ncbi:SemiSWEET transporter [Hirschia maritima]|uniref:SemiSWEET transporter n=1 Tax=Hirschia maritima TaxID=1121961 RepID=UPI00037A7E15|nr:SemiSWEET transporter [Hirschia maritima]
MQSIEYLGFLAAILTTGSFLPQALMTLRTKNTDGISLTMYSLFTIGVAFWFIYGILLSSWSLIIANSITFLLAASILAVKLTNLKNEQPTD